MELPCAVLLISKVIQDIYLFSLCLYLPILTLIPSNSHHSFMFQLNINSFNVGIK